MKIAGSTVLVTGASGGIGGAIARQLARQGANLILVSRDTEKLKDLSRDLQSNGVRVVSLVADLARPDVPCAVVKDALRSIDAIDIVINCAGIQNFGFFVDEATADTAALFHVNVIAPMALVNAVLPHMLERKKGQIVNVGSIFGSIGFPCFSSYSASKFALRGFSEALRRELSGSGIGVTYLAPRFTRTAFNRDTVTRMASAMKMGQDEPHVVAASVINAIEHDGHDRYLGWPERFFVRVNSIWPQLVDRSMASQVEKMRPFAAEVGR